MFSGDMEDTSNMKWIRKWLGPISFFSVFFFLSFFIMTRKKHYMVMFWKIFCKNFRWKHVIVFE